MSVLTADIEDFYGKLYASHAPKPSPGANYSRVPLTRHFTDDLPDVDVCCVTPENRATSELLRAGGNPIIGDLKRFINSVLNNIMTPKGVQQRLFVLQERRQNPL